MAITLVGVIVVVCYIMYTVSPEVIERMGTSNLYLTTIWVLAGILRYLQLTVVDKNSGSPTKILIHDRFIHVCIVGWVLSFGVLINALNKRRRMANPAISRISAPTICNIVTP